jgi:hypothetical protein
MIGWVFFNDLWFQLVLPDCCQFKSGNFNDLDFEKFIVSGGTLQQEKLNDEFGASCMSSGFSKSSNYSNILVGKNSSTQLLLAECAYWKLLV